MNDSQGDLPADSPDSRPIRLGAIDLGTNSIRLVVAEVEGPDSYRVLDEERVQTRLGQGLYETGRLGKEPRLRSLAALGRMKAIADGFEVDELRAIATAALREADNGADFVERAKTEHGIDIEVIGEEQEAGLALRSVQKHFHLEDQPYVIVDIGGGSMEVILVAGTVIDKIHSLPLGAIRLTESFLHADPIADPEWKALRHRIDRILKKRMGKKKLVTPVMIGSGGTFTAFATMAMFERQGEAGPVQGLRDDAVGVRPHPFPASRGDAQGPPQVSRLESRPSGHHRRGGSGGREAGQAARCAKDPGERTWYPRRTASRHDRGPVPG